VRDKGAEKGAARRPDDLRRPAPVDSLAGVIQGAAGAAGLAPSSAPLRPRQVALGAARLTFDPAARVLRIAPPALEQAVAAGWLTALAAWGDWPGPGAPLPFWFALVAAALVANVVAGRAYTFDLGTGRVTCRALVGLPRR
jgi:hypothetical protein